MVSCRLEIDGVQSRVNVDLYSCASEPFVDVVVSSYVGSCALSEPMSAVLLVLWTVGRHSTSSVENEANRLLEFSTVTVFVPVLSLTVTSRMISKVIL